MPSVTPSTGATPGQQITVSGSTCTKDLFGGDIATGGSVDVTANFVPPVTVHTTAAGTTGDWSVQLTVPADANGTYTIDVTVKNAGGAAIPGATGTGKTFADEAGIKYDEMAAEKLYRRVHEEHISMCGIIPTTCMLIAALAKICGSLLWAWRKNGSTRDTGKLSMQ